MQVLWLRRVCKLDSLFQQLFATFSPKNAPSLELFHKILNTHYFDHLPNSKLHIFFKKIRHFEFDSKNILEHVILTSGKNYYRFENNTAGRFREMPLDGQTNMHVFLQ